MFIICQFSVWSTTGVGRNKSEVSKGSKFANNSMEKITQAN